MSSAANSPTLAFTATDAAGDVFALGNAYRAVFTNEYQAPFVIR